MHECAIGSGKTTKILVACYNLIISNKFYPERWLKILNTMLEKEKGQLLGKLRTMQLVEVDFQLIMRVFMNERMAGLIETDKIISKGNYDQEKGAP